MIETNSALRGRKKHWHVMLACWSMLTVYGQVAAATTTKGGRAITLHQVIENILQHNPELKGFAHLKQLWRGRQMDADQAPALEFNIEAENVLGTGDYHGLSQADLTLSLGSVLERGDQRKWRRQRAEGLGQLSQTAAQIKTLDVLAQATQQHITLLALQAQMALADEATELAEKTAAWVEKQAQKGTAYEATLLQAKAAVSLAEMKKQSLAAQHHAAKLALASTWGLDEPDFDTAAGDLMRLQNTPAIEELLKRVSNSPHLEQLAQQSRLQVIESHAIEADSQTNIAWQVGVSRLQGSQDMALTAGISVPLFSNKRNQGRRLAAHAKRQKMDLTQSQVIQRFKTQLRQAHTASVVALQQVDSLKNQVIPLLTKAHKSTESAFRRGGFSYQELITSQQQLLAAKQQLVQAATDVLRQQTTIEQLTASPLHTARTQP